MKKLNLKGDKYGRLLVLGPSRKKPRWYEWEVQCDCGTIKWVSSVGLRAGTTKSCGCLKKDEAGKHLIKHGHYLGGASREALSLSHAIQRCENPKDRAYKNYGGRGIKVSPIWRNDIGAFVRDMGPCPEGMTIDRIDNNRGYEPGNCRWATRTTQNRNRRNNVIMPNGMSMVEYSEVFKVPMHDLKHHWRKLGKPLEEVLKRSGSTAPVD